MSFRLEKLGQVYVAAESDSWKTSHAFLPTPFLLSQEIIRVYVAFLDPQAVGRVGYVDVKASDPRCVLAVSKDPVLDIGAPGCFDDNGVTPMHVISRANELWMYYTGWQISAKVRYFLFVGLAKSLDGGNTFVRVSQVPVLDRSASELTIRTAPYILPGDPWRMWYIGGSSTIVVQGKQVPTYDLRYVESNDGLNWPRDGEVLLRPTGDEYGFGRPWIVASSHGYEMFYSVRTRSRGYHLGYATSDDGRSWIRNDEAVILHGVNLEWDRHMQAFSSVLDTKYGSYLFYNGNEHGRSGFGIAKLERL